MNIDKQCGRCERWVDTRNYAKHVDSCLFNPIIAQRTKTLMVSLATDDIAPTVSVYQAASIGKAPSPSFIQRYFAAWEDFCAWCGLKPQRKPYKPRKITVDSWQKIMDSVDAEREAAQAAERDAFDWSAMPCVERGFKTYYDWRTRSHRTSYVMELR